MAETCTFGNLHPNKWYFKSLFLGSLGSIFTFCLLMRCYVSYGLILGTLKLNGLKGFPNYIYVKAFDHHKSSLLC